MAERVFTEREVKAAIEGAIYAFAASRSIWKDDECWTPDKSAAQLKRIAYDNLRIS